jgi:ABC-type microcin C transport system permease subunit YejE
MKREWLFLALEVLLLLVLLQSNAPEVWFWFIALLVLLTWRSLALRSRLEQRRLKEEGVTAAEEPDQPRG